MQSLGWCMWFVGVVVCEANTLILRWLKSNSSRVLTIYLSPIHTQVIGESPSFWRKQLPVELFAEACKDIMLGKCHFKYRIICLYRVFAPNYQVSQFEYFKNQMDLLTENCSDKSITTIILGDFNLDENQCNNSQYSHSRYYDLLQSKFNELNLIQIIKFNTWSRLVGNTWKESCLDHIYTNDYSAVSNINTLIQIMGDHKIITANIGDFKSVPKISYRRSWKNYTKESLNELS